MKSFNSKILLFGEYALLYGSNALSIPFGMYSGKLDFKAEENPQAENSNKMLKEFYLFLAKNHSKFSYMNTEDFGNDLKDGLYFDSSIPQNYGLGSSGAVVAAVFDRYHLPFSESEKSLANLRIMLSNLESWFHGKSSGIDPLVSYLNKPVLIKDSVPEIVALESGEDDDFKIFLIDTKQESSTGFQIKSFQQLLKNKMFYYLFLEKYIPFINSSISFYLEKNHFNFESIMTEVVDFQHKYFKILFPSFTRELIKDGLENSAYFLKLCGAGGGGFLLGFTQDIENTRKLLAEKNVNLIEI